MLHHYVIFTLKSLENKDKKISELSEKLIALKTEIKQLHHIAVKKNIIESERHGDFLLITIFKNMDDFKVYRDHPAHQRVVSDLKNVCSNSKVIDFHESLP